MRNYIVNDLKSLTDRWAYILAPIAFYRGARTNLMMISRLSKHMPVYKQKDQESRELTIVRFLRSIF